MADDSYKQTRSLIDSELVGEVWPSAEPGEDPVLYGHVDFEPKGAFAVRSIQTFHLTYTVGRYGLDDTGAIRITFRALGDWGGFQTRDPAEHNYVTAKTDTGVPLLVDYTPYGITARPRWKCLTVRVSGGYLREGDRIIITFGDTSGGSPGMKMQTFVESAFEFKVTADVCAVGHFVPIPQTPSISIIPSEPARWQAVLPSLRRPGETFSFGLKAEDEWGNPTHLAEENFMFKTTLPVKGLPDSYHYKRGQKAAKFDNLLVESEGILRITVKNEKGDGIATSHPLVIRAGRYGGYWGDMHGQSGESIGVTTSVEYFDFARDLAFLDAVGHQANDFQINNAFWNYLNELTAEYNEEGRFITFPGYEWSGNTAVGGDHNVYYRTEGRPIHRSSHALLTDRSDLDTDAPDAKILFEKLASEDCVIYAHVGGRYADTSFAHDPKIETAMEIHSAWGTFEWLLTDGFKHGHRCGVVCNSDGHKGRPGASYPGASNFGAYGGLTCFITEDLTRDSLFDCLRRRHHYGTTGTRMFLDVRATFNDDAILFDQDPNAYPDTATSRVREVMMGDIVQSAADTVSLNIEVTTLAPIERIEIKNGVKVIKTLRGFGEDDLGSRIRVIWSGAEYRGRGRDTDWAGKARFTDAEILGFEKINAWNPEKKFEQTDANTIEWNAVTTGNFGGFDVWLKDDIKGSIDITTNHGDISVPLCEIGLDNTTLDAGGLEREINIFRLPDDNPHYELSATTEIELGPVGDNPIWVSVTTEDGFQAWSSPIFIFKEQDN
jgi:hypothetical protein